MASPAAPVQEAPSPAEPETPATPFAALDEMLPREMLGPAAHQRRERVARPAAEAPTASETPATGEGASETPASPTGAADTEAPKPAETPGQPDVLTKEQHEAEVARRIQAYAAKRDADALAKMEAEATERIQRGRIELAQKAREGDLDAQALLAEDVAAQYEREKAQRELLPTAWSQAVTTLQRTAEAAYPEIPALKNPERLAKVVAASATDTKSWLTTIASEVEAEVAARYEAEIEKLKAPDGPIAATIRSQIRDTMPNPDTGEGAGGAGITGSYDSEGKIRAALANGTINTQEARHFAAQIGVSLTRSRRY